MSYWTRASVPVVRRCYTDDNLFVYQISQSVINDETYSHVARVPDVHPLRELLTSVLSCRIDKSASLLMWTSRSIRTCRQQWRQWILAFDLHRITPFVHRSHNMNIRRSNAHLLDHVSQKGHYPLIIMYVACSTLLHAYVHLDERETQHSSCYRWETMTSQQDVRSR
jgi:hypothetical protein